MVNVTLNVRSPEGTKQIPLTGDCLTVGRGAAADVVIDEDGISRVHASIRREGDRVWVIDEGSTNGTFVNGDLTPPAGAPLSDGDEILIGDHTVLRVSISSAKSVGEVKEGRSSKAVPLIVALSLVTLLLVGTAVILSRIFGEREEKIERRVENRESEKAAENGEEQTDKEQTDKAQTQTEDEEVVFPPNVERKLYMQMNDREKIEFVDREAQHVSMMMGNRSYAFTDDVLVYIKKYVDGYASRARSTSTGLWGEGLSSLYGRATRYAPYIIRSFNARGVPSVVGLYIAMIETEYHDCLESPVGAKGLFQFMPETARGYGVDPTDRCDVKKMAPAAAEYMADRIAEFGPDAMSVALAIAGYNRSPDSVRRDLHDVLDSENKERSFWTLVSNSTKLDRPFQNENIKYVPKFIAAAIVGENPWAFGLRINALSTYTEESPSAGSTRSAGLSKAAMDQIEKAAAEVMRRISSDDKPYAFPESALNEIAIKVEAYRKDPSLSAAIRSIEKGAAEISAAARREGVESDLVILTGLADADGGRNGKDPIAAAKRAMPDLLWLRTTFGSGLADGSLIVVAAYKMGTGTKKSHPLLAIMRRLVKNPLTQRNVWYLRGQGGIDSEAYDFVIKFLALGVIAQNSNRFLAAENTQNTEKIY